MTELISQQTISIQEIDKLIQEINTFSMSDSEEFKERLSRWKSRVVTILRNKISISESKKFDELQYHQKYSISSDYPLQRHLLDMANFYIAKLKVLKDEIANYPEFIFDPSLVPTGGVYEFFFREMHPKIRLISENRFLDGHFADSVEAAFKEINVEVKKIFKQTTNQEKDGRDLMQTAFSGNPPSIVLDMLDTETGRNIQEGYKFIFAGSMSAIRNPKAHSNLHIDSKRAMHFLFLASLLFYKLDERKLI